MQGLSRSRASLRLMSGWLAIPPFMRASRCIWLGDFFNRVSVFFIFLSVDLIAVLGRDINRDIEFGYPLSYLVPKKVYENNIISFK